MKVFDIDLYAYFGLDKPEAGRGLLTCYELAVTPEISLERKSPAILVMPGGGYQGVSDREAEPVALTYTAAGYHAFVLRYSTAPARFPTQLREAAMAMIYIRENADALHVRPDRVAALGFSAGGHLCACLGTLFDDDSLDIFGEKKKQVRPDAAVYVYPVITSGEYAHRGSFRNLCGEDTALMAALSLETRVTAVSPPAFLFATSTDSCVPVMNSLKMAEAYAAHGVPFSLYIAEKGCHGLSLGTVTGNPVGTSLLTEMSQDYVLWQKLSLDWLTERDFVPQD